MTKREIQGGSRDGGTSRAVEERARWGSRGRSTFRMNGLAPWPTANQFAVPDDDDAVGSGTPFAGL
jgi:hypothetical protein